MSRKSMFVMLAFLVVLSLTLGGCKKSATPPLEDIQAEDEGAAMLQEAGANPTPVVVEPVAEESTAVPVEEATEPSTPEATEAPTAEATEAPASETVEVVLPVVVSGDEAAATPEATAEPLTEGTPGKHVVRAGENLFRIALRYGMTVEAIAKANGITNAALIYVGQTLTIPGGTPGETPAPTPAPPSGDEKVHIVQPGENLFRIALKYNYSQYYLAKYNGISNPSLIYVGQTIRIP